MLPDRYIYRGDIYCADCATDIIGKLDQGGTLTETQKEDSEHYPQLVYPEGTTDTPDHCGSGSDCLRPTVIGDEDFGQFLETPLTDDGVRYVQDLVNGPDPGPVALFWAEFYKNEGFPITVPPRPLPKTLLSAVGANDDEDLPAYAWPGGYPILYHCADGGTLCPDCANGKNGSETRNRETDGDPQWTLCGYFVHYEGTPAVCDHCGSETPAAYGDPDEDEDQETPNQETPANG